MSGIGAHAKHQNVFILNLDSIKKIVARIERIQEITDFTVDIEGLEQNRNLLKFSALEYCVNMLSYSLLDFFGDFITLNRVLETIKTQPNESISHFFSDNKDVIFRAACKLQKQVTVLCKQKARLLSIERQISTKDGAIYLFFSHIQQIINSAMRDPKLTLPLSLTGLQENYKLLLKQEQKLENLMPGNEDYLQQFAIYLKYSADVFRAMKTIFSQDFAAVYWKDLSKKDRLSAIATAEQSLESIKVFAEKAQLARNFKANILGLGDHKIAAELIAEEIEDERLMELEKERGRKLEQEKALKKKEFQEKVRHKCEKIIAFTQEANPEKPVEVDAVMAILEKFKSNPIYTMADLLEYVKEISDLQDALNIKNKRLSDSEKLAFADCLSAAFAYLNEFNFNPEDLKRLNNKISALCSKIDEKNPLNVVLAKLILIEFYKVQTVKYQDRLQSKGYVLAEYDQRGFLQIVATPEQTDEWKKLLKDIDIRIKKFKTLFDGVSEFVEEKNIIIDEKTNVSKILMHKEYDALFAKHQDHLRYLKAQLLLKDMQRICYLDRKARGLIPFNNDGQLSNAALVHAEMSKYEDETLFDVDGMSAHCQEAMNAMQKFNGSLNNNNTYAVSVPLEMPTTLDTSMHLLNTEVEIVSKAVRFSRNKSCPSLMELAQESEIEDPNTLVRAKSVPMDVKPLKFKQHLDT